VRLSRRILSRLDESAYIGDVRVKDLPKSVRQDVAQFSDETGTVIQYGIVLPELISKADPENLKTAVKAVKDECEKKCGDAVRSSIKNGEKYVLLINDHVVDGHHFIAKAKRAGITSSIPVLDITPLRIS
jgi:hypothetical protein